MYYNHTPCQDMVEFDDELNTTYKNTIGLRTSFFEVGYKETHLCRIWCT